MLVYSCYSTHHQCKLPGEKQWMGANGVPEGRAVQLKRFASVLASKPEEISRHPPFSASAIAGTKKVLHIKVNIMCHYQYALYFNVGYQIF